MSVNLEELKKIICESGDMLLKATLTAEQIGSKSSRKDLVTKYDIEIQEFLKSRFKENWPDYHFLGEEQDEHTYWKDGFLVDPIDGTANFVFGIPHYCISVAVLKGGKVIQGVVFNPVVNELYWAESGQGAYLNGDLLINPDRSLSDTVVGFGSPYDPSGNEPTGRLISKILQVSDVRRLGSAALDLCYIASGCQGGYFEFSIKPWDIAAGMLIAREAGATVTTIDGKEPPLNRTMSILAGGSKVYSELKKLLEGILMKSL